MSIQLREPSLRRLLDLFPGADGVEIEITTEGFPARVFRSNERLYLQPSSHMPGRGIWALPVRPEDVQCLLNTFFPKGETPPAPLRFYKESPTHTLRTQLAGILGRIDGRNPASFYSDDEMLTYLSQWVEKIRTRSEKG